MLSELDIHQQAACNGRCMLSTPTYYGGLGKVAGATFKSAMLRLGFSDSHNDLSLRFSTYPSSRFPLNDALLHGNNEISLTGTCVDEVISVYREFISVLVDTIRDRGYYCCDANLEMLLWCSVNLGDVDTLTTTVRSTYDIVPPCLMTSLLLRSIDLHFDHGVQLLLNYGVSPDSGLYVKDRPISKALELAEADQVDLLKTSENQSDPVFYLNHHNSESLAKMVKSLVDSGADLLAADWHSNAIPLHRLSHLALHSAKLATTILEATPVEGFEVQQLSCFEKIAMLSPLASTLRDVAWLDINFTLSTTKLGRIFSFGIIPLLRAGANMVPDPLESSVIDSCMVTFCQPSPATSQMNSALWQRPNAIVELILAARRKSSLDVEKFQNSLSVLGRVLPRDMADDLCAFGDAVRSQFPLKLQSMCRIQILRHLPAGIRARPAAIKQLSLPNCLSDYLNFSEFTVHLPSETSNS